MVSSRFGIKVTNLRKLLKDINSGVVLKTSKKHIALNPSALVDTKSAINEHIRQLFSKYDSEIGGIVLGCTKVKCCTSHGTVLDDYPHIHFDIEADFFIFQPKVGSILSGIVKKKNNDCISCLVHDTFNVTIPITESLNLDEISYDKELLFTVEHVDFSDSLPYIRGKLLEPKENLESLSEADADSNTKGVKVKKEKKHKKKQEAQSSSVNNEEEKCDEEFNFNDDEFSGSINIDYYSSDDKEHLTALRKNIGLKTPISILKKGNQTSEGTPLKRISFYGDQAATFPSIDNEENIEASNTPPKKKKKKKKDSGLLEDNDVMVTFSDQSHTSPNIDNEKNIETINTSTKKRKKKKKDSGMLEDNNVVVSLSNQAAISPNIYNEENIGTSNTSTKKRKKKKKDHGTSEDNDVVASVSDQADTFPNIDNEENIKTSDTSTKKRKKKKKDSGLLEDNNVAISLCDQADTFSNIAASEASFMKKRKKKKKDSGMLEDNNVMVSSSSDNKELVIENTDSDLILGAKERKKKKKEKKDLSSELHRYSSDGEKVDEELFSLGSNGLSDSKETKDKKSKKKKGHDKILELSEYPEVLEDQLFSSLNMETKEKKTKKKKHEGRDHEASDIMDQNNGNSSTLVRKRKRSNPSKELETDEALDVGIKKQTTNRTKSQLGDVYFEAKTVEYNLPNSENVEGDVNISEPRENSPKKKKRKIKEVSDNEIQTALGLFPEHFSEEMKKKDDESSEDFNGETVCVDSGNNLYSEEKGDTFQQHGKKKKNKKNSMEEDSKSTKIVASVLTEQDGSFPSVFSRKFPNASSTATFTTPDLKNKICREDNLSHESSPGLPSPISKSDEMKEFDDFDFVTSTQIVNNPVEEHDSNLTTPQIKMSGKANKSPKSKNEMQTSFSSGHKSSFFNRLSFEEDIQNVSSSKSIKRLESHSESTLDGPSNIFHKEMFPTTSKTSSKSTSELMSDKAEVKTKKKKEMLADKSSNCDYEDKLKLRNSIVEKLIEAESSALNASAQKKGSKRSKKSTDDDTNVSDKSDPLQKQGKSIGSRKVKAEKKNDVNSNTSVGGKGSSNETSVEISLLAAKLLENLG